MLKKCIHKSHPLAVVRTTNEPPDFSAAPQENIFEVGGVEVGSIKAGGIEGGGIVEVGGIALPEKSLPHPRPQIARDPHRYLVSLRPQKSGMGNIESLPRPPDSPRRRAARGPHGVSRPCALSFRFSARINYRRLFGRFRASVRSRADSPSVRNVPAPVAEADTMRTQERRRRASRNLNGYGRRDGSRAREQSRRRASHQVRLSSIS